MKTHYSHGFKSDYNNWIPNRYDMFLINNRRRAAVMYHKEFANLNIIMV